MNHSLYTLHFFSYIKHGALRAKASYSPDGVDSSVDIESASKKEGFLFTFPHQPLVVNPIATVLECKKERKKSVSIGLNRGKQFQFQADSKEESSSVACSTYFQ